MFKLTMLLISLITLNANAKNYYHSGYINVNVTVNEIQQSMVRDIQDEIKKSNLVSAQYYFSSAIRCPVAVWTKEEGKTFFGDQQSTTYSWKVLNQNDACLSRLILELK